MLIVFDKHPDEILGEWDFAGEGLDVFGFKDLFFGGGREEMFFHLSGGESSFESAFKIVFFK